MMIPIVKGNWLLCNMSLLRVRFVFYHFREFPKIKSMVEKAVANRMGEGKRCAIYYETGK